MNLKAVFFDLDGTLLDTAHDLANALNGVLKNHNKPTLPLDTISKVVSNGAAALIKLGFDLEENDPQYETFRQELLDFYFHNLAHHTIPYDGIPQCIEALSENNIKWGIVTNKPWTYTEPLMKHYSFASEPVAVICPEHVAQKKPAPDALLLACEYANCAPENIFYVGDHLRDIECGLRANSKTIAVSYGYIAQGENPRNWGAHYTVDTASQLWPVIKKYL